LFFINLSEAQHTTVRGDSIGWSYSVFSDNPYPAVSVYGEDGGTAFYQGNNKKGMYITLNGKILLWNYKNFEQVQQLPEDLLNKKSDTVDIEPFLLPDGKHNPKSRSSYGDNLFPFPCGKKGKVSWAYPAGTVTIIFPIVWIRDKRAVYNGTDFTTSYITDTSTNQILKWDGNKLTPVSKIPQKLGINRDEFIRNPASLLRSTPECRDPYMQGQVYENKEVGWYYPRDPDEPDAYAIQKYPIVYVYIKDGGKAIYNGYDLFGSYLTVNNKHFIWDGENITKIDKLPGRLYNTGAPASYSFVPSPVSFDSSKVMEPGDQFMPGYNNSDLYNSYLQTEIHWVYNNQYPRVYKESGIGNAEHRSMCEFIYHGYNEKGSYLSLADLNFLWNGIELMPVKEIPATLYNKPGN